MRVSLTNRRLAALLLIAVAGGALAAAWHSHLRATDLLFPSAFKSNCPTCALSHQQAQLAKPEGVERPTWEVTVLPVPATGDCSTSADLPPGAPRAPPLAVG